MSARTCTPTSTPRTPCCPLAQIQKQHTGNLLSIDGSVKPGFSLPPEWTLTPMTPTMAISPKQPGATQLLLDVATLSTLHPIVSNILPYNQLRKHLPKIDHNSYEISDRFTRLHACNYGPGGNYAGRPVYTTGLSCTACAQGRSCQSYLCGTYC